MHLTHRTCVAVIHWEGEPRKKGYHDTALPRSTVAVSTYDTVYYCIPNVVLDLDILHDSSI
jgi:hypothetical protein